MLCLDPDQTFKKSKQDPEPAGKGNDTNNQNLPKKKLKKGNYKICFTFLVGSGFGNKFRIWIRQKGNGSESATLLFFVFLYLFEPALVGDLYGSLHSQAIFLPSEASWFCTGTWQATNQRIRMPLAFFSGNFFYLCDCSYKFLSR